MAVHVLLRVALLATSTPKGFTGVRFSLYPNVKGEESLKPAILADLGVEVRPDDVSSALLGPEPALFEAVRVAFGRAARVDGAPNEVSMVCTFSAGCPGEPDEAPLPERTVNAARWVEDAHMLLPSRVACQFAVYPLGTAGHMDAIHQVIAHAKRSPAFQHGTKTHFCSMLDGDGDEVFSVLRSSFAIAREHAGHAVMTATLTANKRSWKDWPAASTPSQEPEPPPAARPAEEPAFFESYEALLGELDLW